MKQHSKATKIGRNDPCPCGSGRKYKRCCAGQSGNEKGGSTMSETITGQMALAAGWGQCGIIMGENGPSLMVNYPNLNYGELHAF